MTGTFFDDGYSLLDDRAGNDDEQLRLRLLVALFAEGRADAAFQRLMAHQCQRAHKMLKAGSPLGKTLHGRIGFELRLIILGGQSILRKLEENRYNVFIRRPVLGAKDWWLMLKRAWLKK